MAVYGVSIYGQEFYGYDLPPQFRVDPFVASSINYTSILLTWNQPAGNILAWRLVKNMTGFPVDQDDGEVLMDSLSYPGNQFTDTNVAPGRYHYYAFYVLLDFQSNNWVRSAVTACLAINNYSSGLALHDLMPRFFHPQDTGTPLDVFPSTDLDFFCNVLGWGIDYLKTQYDTYLHVNDPWKIPLNDLYNLATQLGININPDVHPYTLRKAVYFNAEVTKNRGTTAGIVEELDVLTGYTADLQISPNFMLENDQSQPQHPSFPAWSANLTYAVNEKVSYGNFFYTCISTANYGHSPSGTNTANTWWSPILSSNVTGYITNVLTTNQNTWETLWPSVANGLPTSPANKEVIGVQDPLNAANFQHNAIAGLNLSGGTLTVWLRSISRIPQDPATSTFAPDNDQVVGDGIPVPFVSPELVWNGTTWSPKVRYGTDAVVTYNNQPFIALRASTNVVPPYATQVANNEWAPLSSGKRIPDCISAYCQTTSSGTVQATPFVEWYDSAGNFILRLLARNSTSGSYTQPNGLYFDSFTTGNGTTIGGRSANIGSNPWVQRTGVFNLSPFADGCVYPSISSQRTYATIDGGSANCQVGVTFISGATSGDVQGLVLRWQDDNNYIRATMTELDLKQGGVTTTLGTYSSAAQIGDRLLVTLNGSTITVFINNVQVLQVTSSFNTSGTIQGIINEGSITVTSPGTQSNQLGVAI